MAESRLLDRRRQLEAELDRQEGRWGHVAPERWQALLRFAGNRVLDVGCSSGAYVQALGERGTPAVGVDLLASPTWRQPGQAHPFAVGDATAVPMADGSVDTVVAFETLEHVPDPTAALREWRRIARRNLVLSVPNCATPADLREAGLTYHHWVDRTHVNHFTEATLLESIAAAGFSVVRVEPIRRISPGRLVLRSLGLPRRVAGVGGRLIDALARRRYHMSILVVAEVVP